MVYEVKLLKRAVTDIGDICRYLSQFYPGSCGRFLDELEGALDNLTQNPYMYSEYEKNKPYRRIIVQKYLVFYKVFKSAKTVRVYRILHGQRDIKFGV
jgi:plasmid stabilization system protein ParE